MNPFRDKNTGRIFLLALLLVTILSIWIAPLLTPRPVPVHRQEEVLALMKRVADFPTPKYGGKSRTGWPVAVFWMGISAAHQATGDEIFHTMHKRWADASHWNVSSGLMHADALAVIQPLLDSHRVDPVPGKVAELGKKLEPYLESDQVDAYDIAHPHAKGLLPFQGRRLWWWCDALFMAPASLAQMSEVTGNEHYRQRMHALYWDAVAYLMDKEDHLFFRDANFFPQKRRSLTGHKIFWSRGNGWVYAGLIRILDHLPADDPGRLRYLELYRQMTDAILPLQTKSGLWRSSLNEPGWVSTPESSGSGLFTYGLLAGIRRGYLDRETYLPPALKVWAGLSSLVNTRGGVGFAQPPGDGPAPARRDDFSNYNQGIFLLAASELYALNVSEKDF